MAIIKNKFLGTRPSFREYTGPIKYWVDVTPEQVEIKISKWEKTVFVDIETGETTESEGYQYMYWDIIKLSEMQKRPGFVDQTLWTRVNSEYQPPQVHDDGTPYANELTNTFIVDMFAETLASKPESITNPLNNYSDSLYFIFVPDSSSDCTTWTITLRYDAEYQHEYVWEGDAAHLANEEDGPRIKDLVDPITLSSTQTTVSPDSSIKVDVQTAAYIDEIYLEQIYGVLNKTRVKLQDGIGSFSILTTGMESGETVRVKAGHKKFTGISSFSIDIT